MKMKRIELECDECERTTMYCVPAKARNTRIKCDVCGTEWDVRD